MPQPMGRPEAGRPAPVWPRLLTVRRGKESAIPVARKSRSRSTPSASIEDIPVSRTTLVGRLSPAT
ncbi:MULTISPECIES: hypothetical protein [unclassified Streptomyces]|uniref:hypothetical protein n=1 Tax=unclassified Streptomyces TaxID=2593676 RepID=UPI001F040538|nr:MULTISPECIES: hypothetical protein [unclassified Streptomyces]MCH0562934.1 hypothetical protein [Streptomyces sp. MUM 2J]MCH0571661.1 hypothetical protein [Streptomyces sp. MUM 136J]